MDNFRRISSNKKQMVVSSVSVELEPASGATGYITVKYDNNTLVSNLTVANNLIDCNYSKSDSSSYSTITFTSTDTNTSMEQNKNLGYIVLSDGETEITVNVYQRTDYVLSARYYRVTNYYPEQTYFLHPELQNAILFYGGVKGNGDNRYIQLEIYTNPDPVIPVDVEYFYKTASGQEVNQEQSSSWVHCLTSEYPNYCVVGSVSYNQNNYSMDVPVYTVYKKITGPASIERVVVTFHLEYSTTDKYNYHIKVTAPDGSYTERDATINWGY